VKTAGGDVLVPFVKAIVSAVDVKAGTLTVTPPVGLFEDLPDDAPTAEKLVEVVEPDDAEEADEPGASDDAAATPAVKEDSSPTTEV
jgi:16S rRNA processing protein RimM